MVVNFNARGRRSLQVMVTTGAVRPGAGSFPDAHKNGFSSETARVAAGNQPGKFDDSQLNGVPKAAML